MSTISLDHTLAVSPEVVTQELEGEMVLLSLDRAEYFGLNATGTQIWLGLVNGLALNEIARQLVEAFEVDIERARADVLALAQTLVEEGLATAGHGPQGS
jgi:hypothetical protein